LLVFSFDVTLLIVFEFISLKLFVFDTTELFTSWFAGSFLSQETREKREIISNKITSVFLDIFIISRHHFIILYLRCQINGCFIIGLRYSKALKFFVNFTFIAQKTAYQTVGG